MRFRNALERALPAPFHLARTLPDETVICRCEAITAGDIREGRSLEPAEMNRAKAFTRVGMGRCQGRVCGPAAAQILAAARGCAVEEVGRLRGQAPGQAALHPCRSRSGGGRPLEGGLDMSGSRTDVVIVGGGLVGCAAALHLRERGASVAVVEKNQLGAAASGVNFGGVRRNGRKLAELPIAARALAIWKRLPELVGSDCEYEITGNIKVARTDEDMGQIAAHAEAQAAYGVEVEMLGRNTLRDR